MTNAYESGFQKVIPAVLLYAFYRDQILMIHGRGKDGMPGKWNGLGGKLEPLESLKDAAVREFYEEASCLTRKEHWAWLGQLYFPNFKAHKKEDWWVSVFVTDLSPEQTRSIPLHDHTSKEGPLSFVPCSQILNLDLWEGDQKFLHYVFKRIPFEGTFFYESGRCFKFDLTEIFKP